MMKTMLGEDGAAATRSDAPSRAADAAIIRGNVGCMGQDQSAFFFPLPLAGGGLPPNFAARSRSWSSVEAKVPSTTGA